MNIVIISYDYPDERRTVFPFVARLVEQWAKQGHNCCVIAPYSIIANRHFHTFKEVIQHEGQGTITILRPNFISVSNLTIAGKRISWVMHERAVQRALKRLPIKPDVIYGHFWEQAHEGYRFARKHGIPLFVATGESDIAKMISKWKDKEVFCNYLSGVVCVSTKNKQESIALGLTEESKCEVIPNAIDSKLFQKLDKTSCRRELGIAEDDFVVAFVGWFNERKGAKRVAQAIRASNDLDIKSLFVGIGSEEPDCPGILFKGKLQHKDVPKYLNASDIFVLPTLNEGCCNAVVEAMACGLPVISSNRAFNWDILNERNSIMVEPTDINAICQAILRLKTDSNLRQTMAEAALASAEQLTIDVRASKIINFFKSHAT
ncbi:MAG: glycosyltransferase [Bacteroidaceae bacterium]|nr:glycosyltransferase [Bacteroidaceae bacterium]